MAWIGGVREGYRGEVEQRPGLESGCWRWAVVLGGREGFAVC